jgi:dTDP-4-amino-4,6-dideoxygalactose transaminase
MKLFRRPIFISISPNAQGDDIRLALSLLIQPWKWKMGQAPELFAQKIKEYFAVANVFLFESGRTSLFAVLRTLGIGAGDEVLVQSITCTAVVNPILWTGATPIYVDIDNDFNMSAADLEKKITPKARVLVVQHTFGYPANLDQILIIAKRHKLFIIEDVAHALGATYHGKKVGTFGDAAILSFGRYKIISTVYGGAVITNNAELAGELEHSIQSWTSPSRVWIVQQLLHPILLSIIKPLYNIFSIGKGIVIIIKKLHLISLSVYSEEKSGGKPPFGPARMPNAMAMLGVHQFDKMEKFNAHRTELANFYTTHLKSNHNVNLVPVPEGVRPVFLNFPVCAGSPEATYKLIGKARSEGIYLEVWPANNKKVIGPSGANLEKLKYIPGSCPHAENLAPRSMVLPTNPNTSLTDAARVVEIVNGFFEV